MVRVVSVVRLARVIRLARVVGMVRVTRVARQSGWQSARPKGIELLGQLREDLIRKSMFP